jgi:hypothetical protein
VRNAATAIAAAALLACSGLPAEEEGASASAAAVSQSGCIGSLAELEQGRREHVEIRPAAGRIRFDYRNAHFRCEQRVGAWVRRNGSAVDVVVRPVDMSPAAVAKCDCLYDVSFEVPLPAGTYDVVVHRRWDNRHSPNDPVRIGSERITVPAER